MWNLVFQLITHNNTKIILEIQEWLNIYLQKILNGKSAEKVIKEELKRYT